jgi:hypothetical protein
VRQLPLAVLPDLLFGRAFACVELDPGHDLLAVERVRDAEDGHFRDLRVREQEVLDLARVDVLAALMIISFSRLMDDPLTTAGFCHGGLPNWG